MGLDPYGANNFSTHEDRVLTTDFIDDNYEYGEMYSDNAAGLTDYHGIGWEFGDYRIFQKIYNLNTCDASTTFECEGDYGLISQVYAGSILANYYQQCHLPHTILKHTLYFHCTEQGTNEIIDSVWWLYDNTRGTMKKYPFCTPPTDHLSIEPIVYDVCFRPTFPDLGYYYYGLESNSS